LLLGLGVAVPATAAAPRLIMVYGGPLARPVVLADWWGNLAVITGEAVDVRPEGLSARPYLNLALFWGPRWDTYVRDGGSLDALHPEQANEHARFYPAVGEAPALVESQNIGGLRRLPPQGAEVLARHGIPVRLDAAGASARADGGSVAPSAPVPDARPDARWRYPGWPAAAPIALLLALIGGSAALSIRGRV
jgi:hypothetical protein